MIFTELISTIQLHRYFLRYFYGSRIPGFAEGTIKIEGPISIAKNNLVSPLEYSDNFEMTFEYKASSIPSDGKWHEILAGK